MCSNQPVADSCVCNLRSLRQLLDKEMMESSSLRVQVDDLKRDLASLKETHHVRVHALTRYVCSSSPPGEGWGR